MDILTTTNPTTFDTSSTSTATTATTILSTLTTVITSQASTTINTINENILTTAVSTSTFISSSQSQTIDDTFTFETQYNQSLNATNDYVSLFIVYFFYDFAHFLTDFIYNVKFHIKHFSEQLPLHLSNVYNLNINNVLPFDTDKVSFDLKIFVFLAFIFILSIIINLIAWKYLSNGITNFRLEQRKYIVFIIFS